MEYDAAEYIKLLHSYYKQHKICKNYALNLRECSFPTARSASSTTAGPGEAKTDPCTAAVIIPFPI